jgi:hypothetical protein
MSAKQDPAARVLAKLSAAAKKREAAQDRLEEINAECRALTVEALKTPGVRRAQVVNLPFSERTVTKIQHEEGLIGPRKTEIS